jgi:hypothetical protein
MESASVSGDAQINAGMEQTKPSNSLGQTWGTRIDSTQNLKTLNASLMANIANLKNDSIAGFLNVDLSQYSPRSKQPAKAEPAKAEVVPTEAAPAEDRAFYQKPWFLVGAPLLLLSAGVGIYLYRSREQA